MSRETAHGDRAEPLSKIARWNNRRPVNQTLTSLYITRFAL